MAFILSPLTITSNILPNLTAILSRVFADHQYGPRVNKEILPLIQNLEQFQLLYTKITCNTPTEDSRNENKHLEKLEHKKCSNILANAAIQHSFSIRCKFPYPIVDEAPLFIPFCNVFPTHFAICTSKSFQHLLYVLIKPPYKTSVYTILEFELANEIYINDILYNGSKVQTVQRG